MRGRGMVNDRGRVSLTNTSAADLKFLHRLRQTHFRNFKSKSGTRIICLLVPLLLPKFVLEGAATYHELRKRGTSSPRDVSKQATEHNRPQQERIVARSRTFRRRGHRLACCAAK